MQETMGSIPDPGKIPQAAEGQLSPVHRNYWPML